jgi:phosphomethylpyrimidine synthase
MQSEIKQNISSPRSGSENAFSRVYVSGELHPSIRVPFLRVDQEPTVRPGRTEQNPSLLLYDTAGAWLDQRPDVKQGHPAPRAEWIAARADTEIVRTTSPSGERVFPVKREVRRAKSGQNVSQMHYARRGIITPEMEFVAIRENLKRAMLRENGSHPGLAKIMTQHRGNSFGRKRSRRNHPGVCARAKWRADAPSFPPTSITYRARAHGHRPQFPREDQRQSW